MPRQLFLALVTCPEKITSEEQISAGTGVFHDWMKQNGYTCLLQHNPATEARGGARLRALREQGKPSDEARL